MTDSEGFLRRWARLKQESASAPAVEAGGGQPQIDATAPLMVQDGAPVLAAFDPNDLPPIESIVMDTDVRPFLQIGVPVGLTLAALRAAWAADPSIRDFVGVAESQWDFNDPTAMPGFGPLESGDSAKSLLARAAGAQRTVVPLTSALPSLSNPAPAVPGLPESERPTAVADLMRDRQVDAVWLSSRMAQQTPPTSETESRAPALATACHERPPGVRRHGGALPKLPR